MEKKKKLNFWQWMIVISINLYIPFAAFDLPLLLWIGIGFSLFTLFLYGINALMTRKNRNGYYKNKSSDVLNLMRKYVNMNRKYILITSIGIILSVAIFSSTILVIKSHHDNYVSDFDFDGTPAISVIYSGVKDLNTYEKIKLFGTNEITNVIKDQGYNITRIESDLNFRLDAVPEWFNETDHDYRGGNYWPGSVQSSSYTQKVYDILKNTDIIDIPFSYDPNDILLTIGEEFTYLIQKTTNITHPYSIKMELFSEKNDLSDEVSYIYQTINFSKVIVIPEINFWNAEIDRIERYVSLYSLTLLQSSERNMNLISDILKEMENHYIDYSSYIRHEFLVSNIDFYLNEYEISLYYVKKMQDLRWKVRDQSYAGENNFNSEYVRFHVQMPLARMIDHVNQNLYGLQMIGAISTIVLSMVSLFLVYFTISMTQNRKKEIVRVMKSRGTDLTQLQSMLFMEVFVVAIFSSIIGMLLSLGWSRIALNTINFMEFAKTGIAIFIPNYWYYKVPLIAIILSFDISYPMINQLSLLVVNDFEESEKDKPLWQRKHLDLVFAMFTLIYWLVVIFLKFEQDKYYLYSIFWSFLGSYMLLIFLIFAPLFVSRLFSENISWIANKLWRRKGNLTSMSLKTMRKYRFASSKLVSLIIIAVLLSTILVVLPISINNYNEEYGGYKVGSELFVQDIDISDPNVLTVLNNKSITAYSEIYQIGLEQFDASYEYGEFITILGINTSSFVAAAYWQDYYGDLDKIVSSLENKMDIAIDEDYVKKNNLNLGELEMNFENYSYTFNYKSSYNLCPNLKVKYEVISNSYSYGIRESAHILMDIDLAKEIGELNFQSMKKFEKSGVYIKLVENVDKEEFVEYLKVQFAGKLILSADSEIIFELNDPMVSSLIYSSIHALLLFTLIATMISFAFYVYISIRERKIELGMYRTMGMVNKQIFKMFVIENSTILFYGVTFSLLIANIIFFMLRYIFKGLTMDMYGESISMRIILPYNFLLPFILLVLVLNMIISFGPPYKMTKKKVGNILRME